MKPEWDAGDAFVHFSLTRYRKNHIVDWITKSQWRKSSDKLWYLLLKEEGYFLFISLNECFWRNFEIFNKKIMVQFTYRFINFVKFYNILNRKKFSVLEGWIFTMGTSRLWPCYRNFLIVIRYLDSWILFILQVLVFRQFAILFKVLAINSA